MSMRRRLTRTPSMVLVMNRYKKLATNWKAMPALMWERSKLWIALKSTTDVASFTTPSPKTRLYSNGVSSWLSTCTIGHWSIKLTSQTSKVFHYGFQTGPEFKGYLYLQGTNGIRGRKYRSNCCNQCIKISWKHKNKTNWLRNKFKKNYYIKGKTMLTVPR